MDSKAVKFEKFLNEKEIKCFQKEEIKDELETVVFRSFMEVEGQNLPMYSFRHSDYHPWLLPQPLSDTFLQHASNKEMKDYI